MNSEQQALFNDNYKLIFYAVRTYSKIPSYRKEDYEDITQEATIAFARACVLWDKNKTKFATYAMRSMRNRIWQALETINQRGFTPKRTRIGELIFPSLVSADQMRDSFDFDISYDGVTREGRFSHEQVMSAMKSIFPTDRKIIVEHYLQRMSREEIAKEMGISRQMVTQYLRRGLRRLRYLLEKSDTSSNEKN